MNLDPVHMNSTMLAMEKGTSRLKRKPCLPLLGEQDSSDHSLATAVLHSVGQNCQHPRFLHGIPTDLREADWLEDFDIDPERGCIEDEILEQTSSTLLKKVLFDLDGMLGMMLSGDEDEIGDQMDEVSLYLDDDSIKVTKRRRERLINPVEHKESLACYGFVKGSSSCIFPTSGCDREQGCCNSSP